MMMSAIIPVFDELMIHKKLTKVHQKLRLTKRRKGTMSKHPGGRLNKKDGLTRYGNSHVKDKTS